MRLVRHSDPLSCQRRVTRCGPRCRLSCASLHPPPNRWCPVSTTGRNRPTTNEAQRCKREELGTSLRSDRVSLEVAIWSHQEITIQELITPIIAIVTTTLIGTVLGIRTCCTTPLNEHSVWAPVSMNGKSISRPANEWTAAIRSGSHLLKEAKWRLVIMVWIAMAATVLKSVTFKVICRAGEVHTINAILATTPATSNLHAIESDANDSTQGLQTQSVIL